MLALVKRNIKIYFRNKGAYIIVFRFPIFFSGCTALCRHPGRKQGKKQYNYKVSLYHNPVIFLISFNLLSASIGVRALMSNPLI